MLVCGVFGGTRTAEMLQLWCNDNKKGRVDPVQSTNVNVLLLNYHCQIELPHCSGWRVTYESGNDYAKRCLH